MGIGCVVLYIIIIFTCDFCLDSKNPFLPRKQCNRTKNTMDMVSIYKLDASSIINANCLLLFNDNIFCIVLKALYLKETTQGKLLGWYNYHLTKCSYYVPSNWKYGDNNSTCYHCSWQQRKLFLNNCFLILWFVAQCKSLYKLPSYHFVSYRHLISIIIMFVHISWAAGIL